MKEKKLIIGVSVILVILVIIGAVFAMGGKNKDGEENNKIAAPGESVTNFWDNVDIFEGDPVTAAVTDGAGDNGNEAVETETNDKGEVITKKTGGNGAGSANGSGEKNTENNGNGNSDNNSNNNQGGNSDNNGGNNRPNGNFNQNGNGGNSGDNNSETESISEAYPGQAAGWSPIVSPDDLR